MVGFYIKVVERTGKSLQSMFPLTNLWEGVSCGREGECTTCYQGAEALPDCTRQSILYENICTSCVPGATGRRPVEDIPGDKAVLYVGETSRSILERSREHWDGYKKQKQDNHIWKHQMMEHNGEQANFTMRVVGSRGARDAPRTTHQNQHNFFKAVFHHQHNINEISSRKSVIKTTSTRYPV